MSAHPSWQRGDLEITTDPSRVDVERVHRNLAATYWARNIPRALVERAIAHSLCFGIYGPEGQIGFGRVITDQATFAYLSDVYVEESFRGQGLSKWFMECVLKHPDLQGLRRFSLVTRDAHGLYRQFGFEPTRQPGDWMEIKRENAYSG